MPYLNIDDGELDNEDVEALSDAGYRLYSMARLYCARNLTDGYIPLTKLRRLTETASDVVITELERGGRIHLHEGCGTSTCPSETRGQVLVHNYLKWNHSRHWWLTRREKERERKDDYRKRMAAERDAAQHGPKSVPASVPTGQPKGRRTGRHAGQDA